MASGSLLRSWSWSWSSASFQSPSSCRFPQVFETLHYKQAFMVLWDRLASFSGCIPAMFGCVPWDRLRIHHNPHQDKALTEEWVNIPSSRCSFTFHSSGTKCVFYASFSKQMKMVDFMSRSGVSLSLFLFFCKVGNTRKGKSAVLTSPVSLMSLLRHCFDRLPALHDVLNTAALWVPKYQHWWMLKSWVMVTSRKHVQGSSQSSPAGSMGLWLCDPATGSEASDMTTSISV